MEKSIEEIFSEHKNLLYRIAWDNHIRTGRPFDEAISECFYIFMKDHQKCDLDRGEYSTYLYRVLSLHFKKMYPNMGILGRKTPLMTVPIETLVNTPSNGNFSRNSAKLSEMISNLSEEASSVVDLVLNCPIEFYEIIKKEHRITTKLIKKFLRSKGWKIKTVDLAIKEIKHNLQTI